MIQDFITLLIVSAAVVLALLPVFIKRDRNKRPSSCGDCTACSCELAELKKNCKPQK